MRILFAGTPEIAVPSLETIAREHEVCGVLTSPDRSAGRGRHVQFSPVKEKALQLGIPVLQPDTLNSAARDRVEELKPDILVVVAFGKIFGPRFLALFPKGGINLHPSLLPRFRGPSPLTAAILAGDNETGITVQRVAREMDAGDILAQTRIPLTGEETTASLSGVAAYEGATLLNSVLHDIRNGRDSGIPQKEEEASYCSIITKEEGRIDWKRSADFIVRMIRAYDPWPRAYTSFRGTGLSLLEGHVFPESGSGGGEMPAAGTVVGIDKKEGILIQTGEGVLAVTKLQLQAKKALDWKSFLNGVQQFPGSVLGVPE